MLEQPRESTTSNVGSILHKITSFQIKSSPTSPKRSDSGANGGSSILHKITRFLSPTGSILQPQSSTEAEEEETWAPRRDPMPHVPEGLQYLIGSDFISVNQHSLVADPDLLFRFSLPYDVSAIYRLYNKYEKQIYLAFEERKEGDDRCSSGTCTCCSKCVSHRRGRRRPFRYHVTDRDGHVVFSFQRPCLCCKGVVCCTGWCGRHGECCRDRVDVISGAGQVWGYILHQRSLWRPRYTIHNRHGKHCFDLVGQPHLPESRNYFKQVCNWIFCGMLVPKNVGFAILTTRNHHSTLIGSVVPTYSPQRASNPDIGDGLVFGPVFPMELDARLKAVIIAASFMLNILYYEKNRRLKNQLQKT